MNEQLNQEYLKRLRNKLYGILCEKEKGREWEKFLENILIELMGIPDSAKNLYFYTIFYKLSSCKFLEYKYFRNNILECMGLLDRI